MGAQLSLKAAMPLAEILATCCKNGSNTGPCSLPFYTVNTRWQEVDVQGCHSLKRFANHFHSWLCHSWNSVANHHKSLFMVSHTLFYISCIKLLIHRSLFPVLFTSGLRGDDCGVCPPAPDGRPGDRGQPGRPGIEYDPLTHCPLGHVVVILNAHVSNTFYKSIP